MQQLDVHRHPHCWVNWQPAVARWRQVTWCLLCFVAKQHADDAGQVQGVLILRQYMSQILWDVNNECTCTLADLKRQPTTATFKRKLKRFLPCDAMRCTDLVIVILSVRLSHSCTMYACSGGAGVFAARGKRLCCRPSPPPPHPVAYLEIWKGTFRGTFSEVFKF